jgi:arylsulfatase A-like enzyme
LLDIAPTVLDLFGIAAPAHMDGKALVIGDAADAVSETPPLPANQVN